MSTVNLLEELTRELRKKEALEKDFIQLQEENAKLQEENVKLQKEVVKLSQKEDTTLKSQNVCQRCADTTSPTDE